MSSSRERRADKIYGDGETPSWLVEKNIQTHDMLKLVNLKKNIE